MVQKVLEQYIDVGGIKTHYWEIGEGEPLVFIHGGGAGADAWGNWNHLFSAFASKGYRVIAYDMVGFGYTDAPEPSTFEYTNNSRVQHLIQFIMTLDLKAVNLVGNSMGGAAALGATMEVPYLIKRLILLGSAGRHKPQPNPNSEGLKSILDYQYSRENMIRIIKNLTNENFEISDDMVDYRLELTSNPKIMKAYEATMKWVRENGMYYEDELFKKIKQPTLLIHGKNDKVVPIGNSWEIFNLISNSALYAIPNCGHWVMLEYPEKFINVTLSFLND